MFADDFETSCPPGQRSKKSAVSHPILTELKTVFKLLQGGFENKQDGDKVRQLSKTNIQKRSISRLRHAEE